LLTDLGRDARCAAAFGQWLFNIAVRQAVAETPAHRQQDHVGPEPQARKRRRNKATTPTTDHQGTRCDPQPIRQRNSAPCSALTVGLGRSLLAQQGDEAARQEHLDLPLREAVAAT